MKEYENDRETNCEFMLKKHFLKNAQSEKMREREKERKMKKEN